MDLGEPGHLDIVLARKSGLVNVQIRKLEEIELVKGLNSGDLSCMATTERYTAVKEEVLFMAMKDKLLSRIRSIVDEVGNELDECVKSTVSSIRWVRGLTSAHDPIRLGSDVEWSLDNVTWKRVPQKIRFHVSMDFPTIIKLKPEQIVAIKSLVES